MRSQLKECSEELVSRVLSSATNVHKELGPGLNELVYEKALLWELMTNGITCSCQVEVPVFYKGKELGIGFRADMIIDDVLLLELKAVDQLSNIHISQVINYLKLLGIKRGYLLNFNTVLLKDGIKRVSI